MEEQAERQGQDQRVKNAALAILPAVLWLQKVSLNNVPDITDVRTMLRIIEDLGATIRRRGIIR